MIPLINRQETLLFQGDSITDAGRSRRNNSQLGSGYAGMVAARFSMLYPERKVRFLNRGIGGNRAKDLQARWDSDCISLQPDWVSILIGINDTWRRYDSNDPTSVDEFASSYRDILTRTAEQTEARIVIMEPFLLPCPEDRKQWREDLDPKIRETRNLALEFGAVFIPLDGVFAAAASRAEPSFWAQDGVHPTPQGHALIAETWLQTMKAI